MLKICRELVHGIGISVYSVKMELCKPIPSRLTIAHYPVNVFYRGQVQQCFRCEQTGHLSKNCPFKKSSVAQPTRITGDTVVVPASDTSPAPPAPVQDSPLPRLEVQQTFQCKICLLDPMAWICLVLSFPRLHLSVLLLPPIPLRLTRIR